ncbi:YfbM family protein [Kitasatospora sp. NPDC003701]
MSINGRYLRLSAGQLQRAAAEPDWARALVAELDEDEAAARGRLHEIGRSGPVLEFLLRRRGFPVDIVHGEEELGVAGDWGYGPPRSLTPERVRTAGDALAALPPGTLIDGVTPADLAAAVPLPGGWAGEESLLLASGHYRALADFFRTASRYRHGVLVWTC